jgi:NADH pyrophosphatase NudC (nudix superfamily)
MGRKLKTPTTPTEKAKQKYYLKTKKEYPICPHCGQKIRKKET